MIRTSLRIYRLPVGHEAFEGAADTWWHESVAEELLAHLRGEEVDTTLLNTLPRAVTSLYGEMKKSAYFYLIPAGREENSSFWEVHSKAKLRRTFQLIDDFCETYPDEDRIVLPFSQSEIDAAMDATRAVNSCLRDCLECLRYLNPKDNTYYFRYDTAGVSATTLLELASKITREERMWMLDVRRKKYRLPMQGLSWDILGHVFEIWEDCASAELIFSSCPTYLLQFFVTYAHESGINRLLLTESFCNEPDTMYSSYDPEGDLVEPLMDLLTDSKRTWAEIGHLLALISVRHSLLDNAEMKVRLPCRVSADNVLDWLNRGGEALKSLVTRMSEVCPIQRSVDKMEELFLECRLSTTSTKARLAWKNL